MKKGKFVLWVDAQGGVTPVAAKLGVVAGTVGHWVGGRALPRPLQMQKLVKLGAGAFDYEDIICETTRAKIKPGGGQ